MSKSSDERSKLTKAQVDIVCAERVPNGVPVRFLKNGCAMDISTGELCSSGSNIMYHPVYWSFTKETSKKIASWLGAKAVFSKTQEETST